MKLLLLLNVSVCYLKLPNFKSTVDAKNDSCVDVVSMCGVPT